MGKFIRIPGLLGFITLLALAAVVVLVFLDTWIKLAAIRGLEDATGAEVNIASVEHSFSPFGVTLQDVQLTDPKKPTHNQARADSISASLELMPLLLQKLIIDELTVVGVQVGTQRLQPGEVYRLPEHTDTTGFTGLPNEADIPSVEDILARSPLKTTRAADAVEQSYQTHQQAIRTQYAALPDKDKLNDYKTRLKALQETDFKDPVALSKAKDEFDAIKQELKNDKATLVAFQSSVTEAKNDLSPKLAALKAAPGQDYDQLKGLVAGDTAAIEEVTRMVLGDKAAQWSQTLLTAMNTLAPMLESTKKTQQTNIRDYGRWYEFDDTTPLPDLLIRRANVSFRWQQESVESVWTDITHQHEKLGRPTTFDVSSTTSALWQSLQLNGHFAFADNGVNGTQSWDLAGLVLDNLDLLQSEKLTTYLNSALMASKGSLTVEGNVLSGNGKIDLNQLSMTAEGQNNLTKLIASTVSGLSDLNILTEISGSIDAPAIAFTSNLDTQLGSALLNNLSPEQTAKLDGLKSKLNDLGASPLQQGNSGMAQWLEWESLATGDLNRVEEMLTAQFTNALEKEKDKLLDKLKGKLLGN